MLCCIFINTGHPSNFSYGASLVTVDDGRHRIHCSAILKLRPPTRCIIRATVANSNMLSICRCSRNILVTFCSFQLAICVDRRQSWWKRTWIVYMCAASSSDVSIFCLIQVAMVHFFRVYRFQKISQNVCTSTWWRQNDIVFASYAFLRRKYAFVCSNHFDKLTCICVCQLFGLRRSEVCLCI